MITEKQRRRALARAKWERQQARRTAAQRRARTVSIILGAAASVVVILFVGWGVHHLVTDDSTSPGQPISTDFPSNTLTMKTVSNPTIVTSFSAPTTTGSTSTGTTGTTGTTTPTSPVTTDSTGSATP